MTPQIITVHNIHEAIEDVGIVPYANTIVQELGGGYFFVDAEMVYEIPRHSVDSEYSFKRFGEKGDYFWWVWRIYPVPMKIAYFIIQALQLKSRMAQLGIPPASEIFEGSMSVYLTPGKELFGKKIEKLTEIPAELRPVVVERL